MNYWSIENSPHLCDEAVLCLRTTGNLAKNQFLDTLLLAACRKNTQLVLIPLVESMKLTGSFAKNY